MKIFSQFRYDLPASIIVFLVALPLCLGIALASGAPLFAGIIAGIIGGIVVGAFSGSALGVSGPAAGLATICFSYISTLGSWEAFLLVVMIAGIIQLAMGYLKLGTIAYYFPSAVINGMLTGIGCVIIIKQIPHAIGYNSDFDSEYSEHLFGNLSLDLLCQAITPGVILISSISILLLIFWESFLSKKYKIFQIIPAPLVVVILGITQVSLFARGILPFTLEKNQLVEIPTFHSFAEFFGNFKFPDFSQISNLQIYSMALVVAIIASLETLLSTEACDKIDPQKRVTPTNRELKAQGIGNILSGLIGGLPITQVIVRSSTNVTFGAKTKLSTILHGFILLIAVITIPALLNLVPLASLACILLVIGYKLAKPALFKKMYRLGAEQFVPFIITVIGVVALDLLKGIGLGMAVAIAFIVFNNFRNSYHRIEDKTATSSNKHMFKLAEEVSFLNRGSILQMLNNLPGGSDVVIDGSHSKVIHHDVVEILKDFQMSAKSKNISLQLIGIDFKKLK